jgi:hypothetical protein
MRPVFHQACEAAGDVIAPRFEAEVLPVQPGSVPGRRDFARGQRPVSLHDRSSDTAASHGRPGPNHATRRRFRQPRAETRRPVPGPKYIPLSRSSLAAAIRCMPLCLTALPFMCLGRSRVSPTAPGGVLRERWFNRSRKARVRDEVEKPKQLGKCDGRAPFVVPMTLIRDPKRLFRY